MIRRELLATIDSPLRLVCIEAMPGAGKRTLLTQWQQEDVPGHRVLIDAATVTADGPGLLRVIWSVLASTATLPRLPDNDDDVLAAALLQLQGLGVPVAIGVLRGDQLDAETFRYLAQFAIADRGPRLIVAGIDLGHVVEVARCERLPFQLLGDLDLGFSVEQTHELMVSHGVRPAAGAAVNVRRETSGLPGLVLAALQIAPDECAIGVVTSDRALAAYLSTARVLDWPIPFLRFLATMIGFARFSLAEAISISQIPAASAYLHRLHTLRLGTMVWSRTLHERVFHWDRSLRSVIRSAIRDHPVPGEDILQRARAATAERGDHALLAEILVELEDLVGAERVLRDWLWDVVPNGSHPLWEALQARGPLTVTDFPSLLCVRLRGTGMTEASVAKRAAVVAMRALADGTAQPDPWRRLGDLARAIELTQYGQNIDLPDLVQRARGLIADLDTSNPPVPQARQAISDLLMIAGALLRAGSVPVAAEFAAHADQLCAYDPAELDPLEQRRQSARLLQLLASRERGLVDPMDASDLLAGPSRLWRKQDIVAAQLCLMWTDLDRGDLNAADTRCRVAMAALTKADTWPVLLHAHLRIAVLRRQAGELPALLSAYEQARMLVSVRPDRHGNILRGKASRFEVADPWLSVAMGRSVAVPDLLPPDRNAREQVPSARSRSGEHLRQAVEAVRTGHPKVARSELDKAIAATPPAGLVPQALVNATVSEVRELERLSADHPGAGRLHLPSALRFAAPDSELVPELSEREHDVLKRVRAGLTNKHIAEAMFVSVNTVKFHRSRLMRKLNATNRSELLEAAAELGL